MNILLISPNTLAIPYPVYPLGLDYVAASVADRHQVRIADMNLVDRKELARILRTFRPAVIGLSCRNIDNTDASDPLYFVNGYRELIAWLRRRSRAVIVCGGSGFTIMPETLFPLLGADYGIVGEGERFALLVDALEQGRDGAGLPGVLTSGRRIDVPPPWPGRQSRLFGEPFTHYRHYLEQGGMLNLQTKRGCSFRCIYCPYPFIEGRRHRLQDPDEVARMALRLQEAGARYLFITDSAFNSDVDHSLAVARAFIRHRLAIPWGGFFAPIRLPADYFSIMRRAGLRHVEFGTESLSDAMLQVYRKPFRSSDVRTAHKQARDAGLHVAHYLLLGGPGESEATVTETLDRAEGLEKTVFFFFIGIRIYPCTTLYDMALAEGRISPDTDLVQPVFYESDRIDAASIANMVRRRARGRPNWILGSGGRDTAATVHRMHERGHVGPLWEYAVR